MATGIGHSDRAKSVNARIQMGMTAARFNIVDMVVTLLAPLGGDFDFDVCGLNLFPERQPDRQDARVVRCRHFAGVDG